jgi:hypothetical protein
MCAIGVAMLFAACSSSGLGRKGSTTPDGSSDSYAGSGGTSGTGTSGADGTTATGGVTSSGGVTGTGGVTNTGGFTGSGGVTSSGGVAGTGGVANTGGVISSSGVTRTGGIIGSGGVTSSGGISSAGSVTSTAGVASSGGVTTSGGLTNTGGVARSGGITASGGGTTGHYQMENLDRGVVAVIVTGGVYVGWRMFGYEYDTTASNVAYNLYRDGTKIATVTDSTNFLDAAGTASSSYTVTAVIKGTEGPQSLAATPWAQNYSSIPLTPPPSDPLGSAYEAKDGSSGDLDGDGQYDIVLKWEPPTSESELITTENVFLDGYTLAGRRLWRIDLGPNICAGAQYTQFSVYDFDGDGKAEVACKTAPGTKDGTGQYLSKGPAASDDDSQNFRNTSGYVLTGPEYLTVFDGTTGAELATIDYPVPRGTVSDWGDNYGNRVDRFNGGVAFVKDGGVATGLPSIIQGRGYYTRLTVSALTWRNGTLAKNWIYDSVTSLQANGAGNHSEMAADTDGDGGQEIITGQTTIASDGTLQCQTGMGHGDAMHVGELVVGKGISVFAVHEGTGGQDCHDAATCKFYFNVTGIGDNTRGVAEYVSPDDSTAATCSSALGGNVNCGTGAAVTHSAGSNFLIYWDADESRELENGVSITKASGETLLNATGCAGTNGIRNNPTLTADLLGDWREELVLRETTNTALRVYTTTDVTKRRIYTLMHDPTYRAQVAFEQSGYNQPPHVGFHIGAGMADPPKPDIHVK